MSKNHLSLTTKKKNKSSINTDNQTLSVNFSDIENASLNGKTIIKNGELVPQEPQKKLSFGWGLFYFSYSFIIITIVLFGITGLFSLYELRYYNLPNGSSVLDVLIAFWGLVLAIFTSFPIVQYIILFFTLPKEQNKGSVEKEIANKATSFASNIIVHLVCVAISLILVIVYILKPLNNINLTLISFIAIVICTLSCLYQHL